jgi:hypothetical protein
MILQDGAQILIEAVTKFARLKKYWTINGGGQFHLRRRSRLPAFVNLFTEEDVFKQPPPKIVYIWMRLS